MYPYSIMKGYVQLSRATAVGKKWKMTFFDTARKKIKTVSFGAEGYLDFTQHGDLQRKMNYLQRHEKNENWSDAMSAGALSKHLLWHKTSLSASYKDFRNKFNYELY
jgi:hypothetical protein